MTHRNGILKPQQEQVKNTSEHRDTKVSREQEKIAESHTDALRRRRRMPVWTRSRAPKERHESRRHRKGKGDTENSEGLGKREKQQCNRSP